MTVARHSAGSVGTLGFALALGGCEGIQSALDPSAAETARIADLTWILFWGGGAILLSVVVLTGIAIFGPEGWRQRLGRDALVIAGGLAFPIVTLTVLLGYGLHTTSVGGSHPGQSESFRITVVGERWWWRVIYRDADGRRFESANELRIPVDQPVDISLLTADVIHSFWVPKLAGKLDMIPGRRNLLRLTANRPGVSRGQCAEYCGGPHALMAFHVVAMEQAEFDEWFAHAARPADAPQGIVDRHGQELFLTSGCGACHTIRGTEARGTIGPDLTHVGGRVSLAAGTLENDARAIASWIARNQHIKPENLMPPFGIFSTTELSALSSYLANLR